MKDHCDSSKLENGTYVPHPETILAHKELACAGKPKRKMFRWLRYLTLV